MSLYHNAEMIRGLVMAFHDKLRATQTIVPDDIRAIQGMTFEMERLFDLVDEMLAATDNGKGAA